MVRLVTKDPRIKRVVGASDETAALVSRVQALEAKSTGATTSSIVRFRCGEKTSRSLR